MIRRLLPSWKLVRWMLIAAAVGLVGLILQHEFVVRRDGEQRLAAVIAELDATDPGWRLEEIEAARAVIPDGENSAPLILRINPHGAFRFHLLGGPAYALYDVHRISAGGVTAPFAGVYDPNRPDLTSSSVRQSPGLRT